MNLNSEIKRATAKIIMQKPVDIKHHAHNCLSEKTWIKAKYKENIKATAVIISATKEKTGDILSGNIIKKG